MKIALSEVIGDLTLAIGGEFKKYIAAVMNQMKLFHEEMAAGLVRMGYQLF